MGTPLLESCVDLMQVGHHWFAPRERELFMLKTEISYPWGLSLVGRLSVIAACAIIVFCNQVSAQEQLPWKDQQSRGNYDVYREVPQQDARAPETGQDRLPNFVAPESRYRDDSYGSGSTYNRGGTSGGYSDYDAPAPRDPAPAGRDYDRADYDQGRPPEEPYERYEDGAPPPGEPYEDPDTFSQSEIMRAGHGFFGSVSTGLAQVIEKAFQEQGRPNGYILGEDAGGAFFAGLRYGEGRLYTRDAGTSKVYWQGPTLGYDFGAEGSKTMVLIYNLRDPSQIYQRFGGVQGSAYLVGGVGLQLMQRDDVTLALIRSGVGLRLGANLGYLKYTSTPTWNPF